ncbi:MAG: hypothetical protein HQ534_10485 [Armatimonadetes bacterium]|nr:hypothetical protein [Armatimonadota bacterium]
MKKRFFSLLMIVGLLVTLSAETTVGGHIRMTLIDMADGESTINDTVYSDNSSSGMAFTELILYISHDLSDYVSIDMQPSWSASTSASPSFGKKIGEQLKSGRDVTNGWHGWVKAVVTAALPNGYDVSVGIVKPRFTWDYGAELFWEEVISGSKWSCNGNLGDMADTGIEVYKAFEFDSFSLPAYFYLLNGGSRFGDNNKTPMIMLHAEPEFGALKFLGSVASGKYDDDDEKSVFRYAFGASYTAGAFNIRSEVAGSTWEDKNTVNGTLEDDKPFGYYVHTSYALKPWAKLQFRYDFADNNGSDSGVGDETYTSIKPGLQLLVADGAAILVNYDIATRIRESSGSKLEYGRLIVGMRVTF